MTLTEIAGIIEDAITPAENSPVFMLKDLVKLYREKLLNLGATHEFISKHVTRGKEEILKRVDGLCEKKQGKHVLLTRDEDIGHALKTYCIAVFPL